MTKPESLYKKALSTKRNILGKNHRDYVITLSSLAVIKRLKGDYNSAESLYQQALDILHKTTIDENHLDYATIYDGQATVCFNLGDYDKAELLYERALDIRHKILGENHPDYAFSLNNLASSLFRVQ